LRPGFTNSESKHSAASSAIWAKPIVFQQGKGRTSKHQEVSPTEFRDFRSRIGKGFDRRASRIDVAGATHEMGRRNLTV
jgi:hypothetical protein